MPNVMKDDVSKPLSGKAKDDVYAAPKKTSNPKDWETLGGGSKQELPPAVANAQQWSQSTPAYDAAYFAEAAKQDQARRKAAVSEQTSAARDNGLPKSPPAWLGFQPFAGGKQPSYGGSYNPTVPHYQPTPPVIPQPSVDWYGQNDPHHSMNPMIDYYPEVSGPLLPWWQQPNAMPTRTPAPTPSMVMAATPPPAWSGNGFGSSYGGNWRKGGGGGGGGGYGGYGGRDYGDGYNNDYPAWMQNMGLYSWKFG